MVRRVAAEARAIWAGGIPQASFATPKTWMNTSSVGRTKLRPFCGWDVEAIVGACVSRRLRRARVSLYGRSRTDHWHVLLEIHIRGVTPARIET